MDIRVENGNPPHLWLLRENRNGPVRGAEPGPEASRETEEESKKEILCRHCRQGVTDPEQIIEMQGGHRHTFANPHGIVFEIGCFRAVKNVAAVGPSSGEFSWFPGFRWRVLICAACLTHLGWLFTSDGSHRFFGLIVDRLVFPE